MVTKFEEKSIIIETEINASVDEVWEAWTTPEGVKSFFAPDCKIELTVNGEYEIYFDKDAPAGSRGSEGVRIMAIQPGKMFSFNWNAPPHFRETRNQRTHVTLRFYSIDQKKTRLILIQDGWGDGGEWDLTYEYFVKAWGKIVIPRLKYRFENGPIDWENPPELIK